MTTEQAGPQPAHTITETRTVDLEKVVAALQPIVDSLGRSGVDALTIHTKEREEGTTARARIAEEGATARARAAARGATVTIVVVALAALGLCGFALVTGNVNIAEKIAFGLFAFIGGLGLRR